MILETPEQARDYFEWHVQNGRGQDKLVGDQRGLSFLQPKHHANIRLGTPPTDETFGDGKVYFRLEF